jgi:hypothetical protein
MSTVHCLRPTHRHHLQAVLITTWNYPPGPRTLIQPPHPGKLVRIWLIARGQNLGIQPLGHTPPLRLSSFPFSKFVLRCAPSPSPSCRGQARKVSMKLFDQSLKTVNLKHNNLKATKNDDKNLRSTTCSESAIISQISGL